MSKTIQYRLKNKGYFYELNLYMEWHDYKKTVIRKPKIAKHKQFCIPTQPKKSKVVDSRIKINAVLHNTDTIEPRLLNDKSSVNYSLIKNIKRNKVLIDLVIDLHGYNRENAYQFFIEKFNLALQLQYKIILVITGKGNILREELSRWLYQPLIANKVFYFTEASQIMGGAGAFYLALRKK
jgi:DNA-nicking Smr family endonuclease